MRVSIPHVINLFKPARGILSDARQAAQSEARLPIDKSQIIKTEQGCNFTGDSLQHAGILLMLEPVCYLAIR